MTRPRPRTRPERIAQALALIVTLAALAAAALGEPPRGDAACAREGCRCLCARGAPGDAGGAPLL